MKKPFNLFFYAIAFLSLITFSFGCKKKDSPGTDSGTYFIKFKVNGAQKEFGYTSGVFTQINLGGGYPTIYTASFQGISSSSTPTVYNMSLNINDLVAIAINKNYKSVIIGSTVAGSLVYMDAVGLVHGSDFVSTGSLGDDDAVIKLTEITTTSVSGTFTGKVASLGAATALTITEGTFRIKKM